jgi:hypothetical protein
VSPTPPLAGVIERVVLGEIDAIAFTSASQARRLFDVARAGNEAGRLTAALRKCAWPRSVRLWPLNCSSRAWFQHSRRRTYIS